MLELYITEETYLDGLRRVITLFHDPAHKSLESHFSAKSSTSKSASPNSAAYKDVVNETLHSMFGNIVQILRFHDELFARIEERYVYFRIGGC